MMDCVELLILVDGILINMLTWFIHTPHWAYDYMYQYCIEVNVINFELKMVVIFSFGRMWWL